MSEQYDIYRNIMYLMMHAKRHLAQIMDERQMTPVQGMLLTIFQGDQGISMQKISQILGCDASNVTGLVDRLDSQDLIERSVDPNDRRVKVIKLSKKGYECRDAMFKALREAEAADLQRLTSEEQKTLNILIMKLTEDYRQSSKR